MEQSNQWMIKRGIFVFFLFLCSAVALAESPLPPDMSQLNALTEGLLAGGNEFLVKLDAAIAAGKEGKIDVSELQKLRDEFNALLGQVRGMNSVDEARTLNKNLNAAAEKVRAEAKRINLASRKVKDAVDDALKAKKKELEHYRESAREARKEALLKQYEQHVAQAKKKLEKMKAAGLNTLELEAKIKDLEALQQEIQTAIAAEGGSGIDSSGIKTAFTKLKTIWHAVQQAFMRVEHHRAIRHALENGEKKAEDAESKLAALQKQGVNTKEIEAALLVFKTKFADAQAAAGSSNYAGAKNLLQEAHASWGALQHAFGEMKEQAEHKIEKVEHAKQRLEGKMGERGSERGKAPRGIQQGQHEKKRDSDGHQEASQEAGEAS